MVLVDNFVH